MPPLQIDFAFEFLVLAYGFGFGGSDFFFFGWRSTWLAVCHSPIFSAYCYGVEVFSTTGRAGGFQGETDRSVRGELINGGRVAGQAAPCHEKSLSHRLAYRQAEDAAGAFCCEAKAASISVPPFSIVTLIGITNFFIAIRGISAGLS